MTTTLGERIKARLTALNYRQADLVRACGVSRPTVSDWVNGHVSELKGAHLVSAARFLQCTPQWLSTGIGTPSPGANSLSVQEATPEYAKKGHPLSHLEDELLVLFRQLADNDKREVVTWVKGFSAGRKNNTPDWGKDNTVSNQKKSA